MEQGETTMTLVDSSEELMAPPSPNTRRVMQIVAGSETNPIYALCADDSIWYLNKENRTWYRIPDVPAAE
jgi:hypothetical protein